MHIPFLTCLLPGFSRHLVHASDADQAEALLTRWGPDGMGKIGGIVEHFLAITILDSFRFLIY